MEFITFLCPNCQQPLKIPADKAGRKAKCNKCGHPLTIPSASENVAIKEARPAPTGRKPAEEEQDEGPAVYGIVAEPEPPAPPKPRRADDEDEDEDEDDD
jgi:DNA-directed RNA polymerase subunit M/transcription elongation factor TFIIS